MHRMLRALSVGAAALGALAVESRVAAAAPTVVSFTFDDGLASQTVARGTLASAGVPGTFYVNTNKLGHRGSMAWSDVAALAADGHEIGGHTLDHVDLRAETPEERRRQICDDRQALTARGYAARSFAYPFGRHDAAVRATVGLCGYDSARTTTVYDDHAAPFPPAMPFGLPAWQATGATTLEEMQQAVLDAEAGGGGWVPFVFHDLCDTCEPDYGVAPSTFAALVDWVAARRDRGTIVRTVGDVVDGRLEDPDPPTPDPPTSEDPPDSGPLDPDLGDRPPFEREPVVDPPLPRKNARDPRRRRVGAGASVLVTRVMLRASGTRVAVRIRNRGRGAVRVRVRIATAGRHRIRDQRSARSFRPARIVRMTGWKRHVVAAGTVDTVPLRLRPAAQRLLRTGRGLRVRIAVQVATGDRTTEQRRRFVTVSGTTAMLRVAG